MATWRQYLAIGRDSIATVTANTKNVTGSDSKSSYRPDIDGLRALAVVAVIINHFNNNILPGGYLGVDIFFVISGFVITSSLAERPSENFGNFLIEFYTRRIKRLVPTLVLFIIITSVFICLFNPNPGIHLQTGMASLFGFSNLFLLKNSTDYFATSTELNPFTHIWSIGVEEQFYFLFPFLFWFTGFSHSTVKGSRNLFWVTAALSVASLIAFVHFYHSNQPTAYFLMPTRLWELGAGCLLFLCLKQANRFICVLERIPPLLATAGVLVALFTPLQFAVQATIAIVMLTVVLIACLRSGTTGYDLFTHQSVVYIGLLSYSLYLWHWGILSLCRWTVGIYWWSVPFQVALMLIVSIASYRYVEVPFRYCNWSARRWQSIMYGIGASSLAASLLFLLGGTIGQTLFTGDKQDAVASESFTGLDGSKHIRCFDGISSPTRFNGKSSESLSTASECLQRPKAGVGMIALLGDSQANSLYPLLNKISSTMRVNSFAFSRGACMFPQPISAKSNGRFDNNCLSDSAWLNQNIKQLFPLGNRQPRVVLINNYYWSYFNKARNTFSAFLGSSNDLDGYMSALSDFSRKMDKIGVTVIVFAPTPIQGVSYLPLCKKEWFRPMISPTCAGTMLSKAKLDADGTLERLQQLSASQANLLIFNPSIYLCPNGFCWQNSSSGSILYNDDHHLSPSGSLALYPSFISFLRYYKLLPQPLLQHSAVIKSAAEM